MKSEDLISSVGFLLQIIKKYMFSPGKIENWIVIIDCNNVSLWSLPLNVLKKY